MEKRHLNHFRPIRPSPARRGAVSKQMLVTAGLVVVIGGCMLFIWGQLSGGAPREVVRTLAFTCQDCAQEFRTTNVQLREQAVDAAVLAKDRARSADQPHCPQCGRKHAGLAMFECLKCGHHFLPTKVNLRTNPDAEVPPPVCPKCGTNLTEWMRSQ